MRRSDISGLNWSEKECLRLLYDKGSMKPGELARALKLSPSTITELLQKLANKGLVLYERYRGAKLSEGGEKIAKKIVKKHRILEVLFVNLGLANDEACLEASKIDYLVSENLIECIYKKLNYPTKCPCGKRIPLSLSSSYDE